MPVEYIETETGKAQYIRIHNNGKIIEEKRDIYLDFKDECNDPVIITIRDITEIRVGETTCRYLTANNKYYIILKKFVVWTYSKLAEGGLQL